MQCQLMEPFFEAVQTLRGEENTPRDYGTGTLLYHSEINLLNTIYRHPEESASALAQALGITRGALTQTARRLMGKDLVEQYSPSRNRKTKYHRLTEKGEQTRLAHARHYAQANAAIQAYICNRSAEERQALLGFLRTLQACGPFCLFSCTHHACNLARDTDDKEREHADI